MASSQTPSPTTEIQIPDQPMYTAAELAQIAGMAEQTLAAMRVARRGPSYITLGRQVRYPRAAVLAWLTARAVRCEH